MPTSGLASEFGLSTEEDVRRFLKHVAWGCVRLLAPPSPRRHTALRHNTRRPDAPRYEGGSEVMGGAMQLWLPMERFEEGLLLLRHALRWDLLDVTYAVLFDSRREDATRWDGRRIKPTPKIQARRRVNVCACRRSSRIALPAQHRRLRRRW